MTSTRIRLPKHIVLAHSHSSGDVCAEDADIVRDAAVAHEARHRTARIVMVGIIPYVRPRGRILRRNQLCGAPCWRCRIRISGLDDLLGVQGLTNGYIPIILGLCVDCGSPGSRVYGNGLVIREPVCLQVRMKEKRLIMATELGSLHSGSFPSSTASRLPMALLAACAAAIVLEISSWPLLSPSSRI